MPRYERPCRVLRGAFRLGRAQFVQASRRAFYLHADLRWGPDRQGYRRLLHPNGVCLTGLWELPKTPAIRAILERTAGPWSSAAIPLAAPRRVAAKFDPCRSLGKLFPTTDPNHAQPLQPAKFFPPRKTLAATTRVTVFTHSLATERNL